MLLLLETGWCDCCLRLVVLLLLETDGVTGAGDGLRYWCLRQVAFLLLEKGGVTAA